METKPRIDPSWTGGSNGNGAAPAPAQALDWRQVARKRLDQVLSEIRTVEQLQQEAEGIVAALRAAGEEGLPALPWVKAAKARRGSYAGVRRSVFASAADRERHHTPFCIECGFEFTGRGEYVITETGSVCRFERLCNERKAARG